MRQAKFEWCSQLKSDRKAFKKEKWGKEEERKEKREEGREEGRRERA